MQDQGNLKILFEKWYQGTASPAEVENLHSLLGDGQAIDAIKHYSKDKWEQMFLGEADVSAVPKAMVDKILAGPDDNKVRPVHRVHFLKTAWFRYAAVILLVMGAGIYLWLRSASKMESVHQPSDIQPGGNRAILTLSNGSTIILDSASIGHLAEQGNTNIIKLDAGSLAYNAQSLSGASPGELLYNTIRTPKGGQYQIVLPDGSKVWLNAASSVRFPTSFTGNERSVEVEGEVYFEIAKDAGKPFSVIADHTRIDVLGTSFNVNAYTDEEALKTTLINGSVRVNTNRQSKILTAGEQAQTGTGLSKITVTEADIDKVMAWKYGVFNFQDVSLQEVMRQLSRWYDIEVVYEKGVPDINFVGEMSRDISLAGLIKALAASNVHFRIENNRRLIVQP